MALVFTKIFYMHLRCDEIDELISDFEYYNRELRPHNIDEEVLGWQRLCYVIESGLYINCFCLVNFFSAAIFLQPLLGEESCPSTASIRFNGIAWICIPTRSGSSTSGRVSPRSTT